MIRHSEFDDIAFVFRVIYVKDLIIKIKGIVRIGCNHIVIQSDGLAGFIGIFGSAERIFCAAIIYFVTFCFIVLFRFGFIVARIVGRFRFCAASAESCAA